MNFINFTINWFLMGIFILCFPSYKQLIQLFYGHFFVINFHKNFLNYTSFFCYTAQTIKLVN